MNRTNRTVLAIGTEAWHMIGRTPANIVADRPLRHGAIEDFDSTQQMIRLILREVGVGRFGKTRLAVCVPSVITPLERRAVVDAATGAGVAEVRLIDQPLAAAIGSGLPISEPIGTMVVDVGGGTAQAAMVSLGGVVASTAERVGSFDIDESLKQHMKDHRGLAVGDRTAEQIKIQIGSAWPIDEDHNCLVKGRDLSRGLPREVVMTPEEVRIAISGPVRTIVRSVVACISQAPAELSQDLIHVGIRLVGGGSLLRGFDRLLEEEIGVPVVRTDSPLETVVLGAGRALENWSRL